MRWRTYPVHRDSGVEWLGEIPEHWRVIRVKSLEGNRSKVVQTGPFGAQLHADDYVDEGIPLILIRNVGNMKIDDTDIPMVSHSDAERLSMYSLRKGDIVFSRVGSIGRIALCTDRENGWLISGQMLRLRMVSPRIDCWFLAHAFASSSLLTFTDLQSVGSTRESINTEILRNVPLPIPSIMEQSAIAIFLDRETSRIDELIAKKQRQIELLQEKRSALISHVVTKGLDPDVRMKDSGIEWLGEIPEHWGAIRFKFLLDEPLQYGANESAEYDETAWPRYVRITDINENGNLREETFKSLPEDIAQPYLLRDGDLLLARSGATVGKTFLYLKSWGRAAYAGYLIRARLEHKCMLPTFCSYFCRSNNYWDWLKSSFIQATIQNVSAERYANMVVPRPPIDEQQAIMAFLDRETSHIDELTEKVKKSIDLLREYRTALISAAVTGKINVREEAPAS